VAEAELLGSRRCGAAVIEVVRGDLTVQDVDAIVNAANSRLQHGGGVAGAIVRRGGPTIQHESDDLAPVPVGGAVVTSGGRLPCRFVIHAVGPMWGEGNEEAKLRSAVAAALARAEERSLATVAMPAISTGIFGYPKADGCRVIVEEVVRRLEAGGSLRLVRLVSIDGETAQHFLAACVTLPARSRGEYDAPCDASPRHARALDNGME
jgi:O-acetyl-ADP-ribose deacetylase (regulator of RNase III)